VRVGVAHHLGWAIVVTADDDHEVVDRRRIELVEADVPTQPFEHDVKGLGDVEAAALVDQVRSSALRTTSAALDDLASSVPGTIVSMSLRAWPPDFPDDIATRCRHPYDTTADSVLYREVLDELARERGWEVHLFEAKDVEAQAARVLGARTDDVLHGPRARLGAPWAKDHRIALAATVVAG